MIAELLRRPTLALAFALLLAAQGATWRLPATIEALRDVEAHPIVQMPQLRDVLYTTDTFQIRKGERFDMVKIYAEGGCRIRFKDKEHDVTSCPWLNGFADHVGDVFRVVSGHGTDGTTPNKP